MSRVTLRSLWRRLRARRSQLAVLGASAAICLLATAVLTARVFLVLEDYRAASSDNVQWTVAKLEVEHAKLLHAATRLDPAAPATLAEMRRRLDIFYSRVDTLANARTYRTALGAGRTRDYAERARTGTETLAAIVDAPDAEVFARKAELLRLARDLELPVTRLSSAGVAYDVERRETQRRLLVTRLTQLILLSVALVATLFGLLALFWHLYRRYRQRALQNRMVLNRLATILNTSQDAILVVAPGGAVIEGNRAAETSFDLARADLRRIRINDILFRAGPDGALVPVTAETLIAACRKGPTFWSRLRARDGTGQVFPVELSAGIAARGGDDVCVCFLRDISNRVANEEAVAAARDRALAGERAKARFLGMISHEMRTPLNGILGALDLLDETPLTPEQTRYAQIMQSSGQLVLNQINDALDVTQSEGSTLSLVEDCFDLGALLDDLIEGQRSHARVRGNRIELVSGGTVPGMVRGDPNRLHQVLLNLLSNAVKFTSQGSITIEVTRTGAPGDPGDMVEFQISDTGAGIPQSDLDRIFDDFVRLDRRDRAEGTGLGLGIARHLITLMGGSIGAESEPGEGSLFWVRLPLPPAGARPPEPRGTSAPAIPPLDVLVVEDNDMNRFVLGEMLRKDNHTVSLAASGEAGVVEARRRRFDLILMDINLPGMDGIEATRQIRRHGASAQSRVVALTAHFRPDQLDRFDGVAFDAVRTKPLRRAVLRDLLAGRDRGVQGTPGTPVLDPQVLEQLGAVLPPQRLARLLGDFRAEGEAFIAGLKGDGRPADADIAAALHQFAGSAATVGAMALQVALCRAETAARSPDGADLAPKLEGLPALWHRTVEALQEFRSAA